jgi:hypothetical protein
MLLLASQCVLASVGLLAPWSGVFIVDPIRLIRTSTSSWSVAGALGLFAIQALALSTVLALLSLAIGLVARANAGASGWRLPAGTVLSIVSHAAIGWTVIAGAIWSCLTA